jgi:hypothetical protein
MKEVSFWTMSDVVKDFNTKELIEYLEVKLDKNDIKILRKEKFLVLLSLNWQKKNFTVLTLH